MTSSREQVLRDLLDRRILLLDGAMGTMLQGFHFTEADFRGDRFRDHYRDLAGNNDLLPLVQPQAITSVHQDYLAAGADIIETCTFGANAISQADYGMEAQVYEMNLHAARLAVEAAVRQTSLTPEKPRFVAGSMGPTNGTLSLSPDVDNPAARSMSFDQAVDAYAEQVRGLMDGGVHLLMLETIFDTLMCKAAMVAIQELFREKGRSLPLIISVTISDASGRTLSGQTIDAFWTSIAHARPLAVGTNCGLGGEKMLPYLAELAAVCSTYTCAYPNAGLPDGFGNFAETPRETASHIGGMARRGLVNLVGGCCGTTPGHIRAIARAIHGVQPRKLPADPPSWPRLSGLETLEIRPDSNFIVIGERTNVTGSRRFARLVGEGRFDMAVRIGLGQARNGANILDICMDDALLDSERSMQTFLRLAAGEPQLARIPFMVDSSRWSVVQTALKNIQGKSVVNSISLKEGQEAMLRKARRIHELGAAMVVMAFDEEGQAATARRKVEILGRAYHLLTQTAAIPPGDIILDPGVLAVGTGMDEHRRVALDFMAAVRELKKACPGALLTAGVSNLSFAFRGNNRVREAMHSAFLYHAIEAGLDMGIVNAGQLLPYDEIDKELLELVEDVLLDRRPDATDRLIDAAGNFKQRAGAEQSPEAPEWRNAAPEDRLVHALLKGTDDFLEEDLADALRHFPTAMSLIQGPLMAGMDRVGDLFGEGKMFLPQVVKSARVMRRAVAILEPRLAEESPGGERGKRARILLATVRGDVHDIGKNILSVVLECNGVEVIDLGVMVPAARILEEARTRKADAIGLSGLITPSLDEMARVARDLNQLETPVPLLIGGATTSPEHAAVAIAPAYEGDVFHVRDASRATTLVSRLLDPASSAELRSENRREQERLRERHQQRSAARSLLPYSQARSRRLKLDWTDYNPPAPAFSSTVLPFQPSIRDVAEFIDWRFFFPAWGIKGSFPSLLRHPERGSRASALYNDALHMLEQMSTEGIPTIRGGFGFWPAASQGDCLVLYTGEDRSDEKLRIPTLRQQEPRALQGTCLSLSDFLAPQGSPARDYLGVFAVTAGLGLESLIDHHRRRGDEYKILLVKSLADRLAEAAAELLHLEARRTWGIEVQSQPSAEYRQDLFRGRYQGIRPAIGYPACPDHSRKHGLFRLLDAAALGMSLTETAAIVPASSVAGLMFSHPESRYFDVGFIGRDQLEVYAASAGIATGMARRWLASRLLEH